MKEFRADTGGRYTYNEDVLNLQELALAFNEIFADCDNFIVSGCEVIGDGISPGYVYMNGKIRRFSGAAGVSQWPQYICEANITENTHYASGGTKIARTIYGCQASSAQPTTADPVTHEIPAVLAIPQTGGKTIKDAFVGRYALVLNPLESPQTVNGSVNFTSAVSVGGDLTAVGGFKTATNNFSAKVGYEGNNLEITSTASGGAYKFAFEYGSGFKFYVNNNLSLAVKGSEILCSVPLLASKANVGNVTLTSDGISMERAAVDATLNINMSSFAGGSAYYRNTTIGDGKGTAIFSVYGASKNAVLNGNLTINTIGVVAIRLQAPQSKSNNAFRSYVAWSDNTGFQVAQFGVTSDSDNIFRIKSFVAGVEISGQDSVNLGPAIRENGVLLSEKYVLASDYNAGLSGKVDTDGVYTKAEADSKFATKNGGFSQFIGSSTALDLRSQIQAVGTNELAAFPKLSNCLSDMAVDEDAKERIRNNIGACAAGDYQAKLVDTGWIRVTSDGLWARQIGNIVYVQGMFKIPHSGNVFTLPNSIDCPTRGVIYTLALANKHSWRCEIAPHQRNCVVKYCDGACDDYEYFTLSYMV